jgi:glycosyltransferase involved in cell wall biosynthesis
VRVCVALEQRFSRLPDGSIWGPASVGIGFWQRYLDVFEQVRCVARVQDARQLDGQWVRADGEGVSFHAVPHYVGPAQYLRRAHAIRLAIRDATCPGDAFVLRVPGNIGHLVWSRLAAVDHPYAVEVIGDPHDVFAPGAVEHPLRRLFRWKATHDLRRQCAGACAASYVTAWALQRRYPSACPSIEASSIDLRDDAIVDQPRVFASPLRPARLIFIGSLDQYYKAPDLLIDACARAASRGIDLRLLVVGDGRYRAELEALAASLGCAERIRFAGQLAAGSVRAALDQADLFVLPSRTEGLPRAMVEAMARGLPCIGTAVGGVPELLPAEALVPPGSAEALTEQISSLVNDAPRLTRLAATNLERSQSFRNSVLQPRRVALYQQLRISTEAWLQRRRIPALSVA